MAITPQPRGGHSLDAKGKIIRQHVEKGPYAEVLAAAKARPKGSLIADVGYVLQWSIQRAPGGLGVVTYNCVDQTSEKWESNDPLSDTWSIKNMQTTIPLMRYCGPSEVNNANWYDITQWKKGTDKNLFNDYQYVDGNGATVTLSAFSQILADKIKLGHESVMRFYPIVTHSRIYPKKPTDDIGFKLSYIDTPSEYSEVAPMFLKIQDDLDELSNGTYRRVEAWQGADELDENFYGTGESRWAFGSI